MVQFYSEKNGEDDQGRESFPKFIVCSVYH